MRVVIFSDTYPPEINGVATSVYNLTKTLREHGEEVLVVTTNIYASELSLKDGILRIPGIKLTWLYDYRLAYLYNHGAMKVIRDFKPDIIHNQADWGVGWFGSIVASKLKTPTVYTFHSDLEDYVYYVTHGHFDRAARNIMRGYVKLTSSRIDEFITPSLKTKEYMRSIGIDRSIEILPTGIDFDAYKDEKVDWERLRAIKKKWNIPEDAFSILSLGRIAKEKSIDLCLNGYARHLKNHPDENSLFLVVGGGPALEELKALSKNLGIESHTRFLGPVPQKEVPLYYRLGNVFVSASITETQGLTFMESMAAGIPLMARYDDSLAEIIKDGENGFFFLDEESFPSKLERVMSLSKEERERIVLAARNGLEPYSLERFYKNIMEVYHRAIRKNY